MITMDEILDKLNEEQIKPVKETEGAVLVLAGAGSGKTRVLTSRIAYILREGLALPSQILAITFTNKAAGEMRERVNKTVEVTRNMWICTIHSMCVRILREYGSSIGIKDNFSIYSETERNNVIKKAFQELDFDDDKLLKNAKFHIGNAKMLGLDPDQYAIKYKDEFRIKDIVKVYELYNEHLAQNNALDFDDLLLKTLTLLRRDKEVLDYLSSKFRYILVDEFQDTNAVQYNIIKLLAYKNGNLFVVGDDDQSIYGWRGAEIENILRFDKDYPNAKVYKLERNYRSTKSILTLANAIIKNNGTRHKKTLWTEAEAGTNPSYFQADEESGEALYAAKNILSAVGRGAKYSDFAVLMRINALTRSYEQEFTKYGIPYKVFGGFKFYERKEIKDVLAYLRLISNPYDDEALERIINVPKRGIGGKTLQVMYEYAQGASLSMYDAVLDVDELPLTQGAKKKIEDFGGLIKKFVISSIDMPVSQLVREVINLTELRSAYEDGTDEGDSKLANLDEFVASVDDFVRLNPQATLDEYLSQITLYSDTDEMDESEYVTLATIHSVKGLEFENVFICGLEDGIMPSSRAEADAKQMEEERRLMYVAITRAKKRLWLTRSKSRYLYGHRDITKTSKFVQELSKELGIREEVRSPLGSYGSGFGGGYSSNYGYGQKKSGGYSNYSDYEDFGYQSDEYSKPQKSINNAYYGGNSSSNGAKSGYGGYGSSYQGNKSGGSYGGFAQGSYNNGYKSSSGGFARSSPLQKSTTNQVKNAFGSYGASSQNSKNTPKYAVGNKVKHPKFGVGTVVAIKNGGAVINVAFDGQGIKELSASLAPLTLLS
ncbi:MAG: ATP-dependent DNA helicase PcrA [Clostridiales bacterium]|nr:ATP-dependent DNA helicase PcrA [Clostridiales bacterium]